MKNKPPRYIVTPHNDNQKGGQQAGLGSLGVTVESPYYGLMASSEDGRSQLRNKEIAMEMILWGEALLREKHPQKYKHLT